MNMHMKSSRQTPSAPDQIDTKQKLSVEPFRNLSASLGRFTESTIGRITLTS